MNIIGDIGGQFDSLLRLVEKMPKDEILLVGDLMDRGPKSRQVIEWAIANNIKALRGNHEDMMIDFYKNGISYRAKYSNGPGDHAWLYNGGKQTLESYDAIVMGKIKREKIPKEHIDWLESLPLYYETYDFVVTHGSINGDLFDWKIALNDDGLYEHGNHILWSRQFPSRRSKLQLFGHNAHWGSKEFTDERGVYAICLDNSKSKVLTGISLPSQQIYQEAF